MISRTISISTKVNKLSDFGALLYTWMIPHCDDFGHLDGEPFTLKAIVCPMRKCTDNEIDHELEQMEQLKLIKKYENDGQKYLEIVKFSEYQTFKNDRKREAKYPKPKFPKGEHDGIQKIPNGTLIKVKLSEEKLIKVKLSEEKKISPREISEKFFSEPSEQERIILSLQGKGIPESVALAEINKFVNYWTEFDHAGIKQRWQKQKTFEVQRRLATWFRNINQFQKVQKNNVHIMPI